MEPSLLLQKAIRSRLVASPALTAVVPAVAIVDRNARPETFPCILIGESQTVPDEGLFRSRHVVYADLHIWQREDSLTGVKGIAGLIRDALTDGMWSVPGLHVADLYITQTRFLRDPGGLHSHGIITLQANVAGVAS